MVTGLLPVTVHFCTTSRVFLDSFPFPFPLYSSLVLYSAPSPLAPFSYRDHSSFSGMPFQISVQPLVQVDPIYLYQAIYLPYPSLPNDLSI